MEELFALLRLEPMSAAYVDHKYLRNATKYHQMEHGVAKCYVSLTL